MFMSNVRTKQLYLVNSHISFLLYKHDNLSSDLQHLSAGNARTGEAGTGGLVSGAL